MCKGAANLPMKTPDGDIICNTCNGLITEVLTKIIKEQQKGPCGCMATTYTDDRIEIEPCATHLPMVAMQGKLDEALNQITLMTGKLGEATRVLQGYAGIIVAYKNIADGCLAHPAYRPTRPPPKGVKGKCSCAKVWRSKMFLDKQRVIFKKAVEAGQSYHPVAPVPETQDADAAEADKEIKKALLDGEGAPFITARQT